MIRQIAILALCFAPLTAYAEGDDHDHDAEHAEHQEHGDEDHADHDHDDHSDDAHAEDGHDDHAEDHAHDDEAAEGDDEHVVELDGAEILHPWTRATDGPTAQVFLELHNDRDTPILITGGDAHEMAASVKLMGAPLSAEGEPILLPEMPVTPGTALEMAPNGVYLLLEGLETPLEKGAEFEMHVQIEPFGEVEIHVEVEAADATQHSHAGHNH